MIITLFRNHHTCLQPFTRLEKQITNLRLEKQITNDSLCELSLTNMSEYFSRRNFSFGFANHFELYLYMYNVTKLGVWIVLTAQSSQFLHPVIKRSGIVKSSPCYVRAIILLLLEIRFIYVRSSTVCLSRIWKWKLVPGVAIRSDHLMQSNRESPNCQDRFYTSTSRVW